ncbi:MAG: hypothetical protein K2Y21_03315 [Phycisphaerales bacterium]|nr:hypothetical protein [Phycisphaerales bacterium]
MSRESPFGLLVALVLANPLWAAFAFPSQNVNEPDDEPPGAATAATPAPSEAAPRASEAPKPADAPLSEAEIAELRAIYNAAGEGEKAELVAYYRDLGIEIEKILGIDALTQKQTALVQGVISAISGNSLVFHRPAKQVLMERAKLASGSLFPNPSTAEPGVIAAWIRSQAVAGEWGRLEEFFGALPKRVGRELAGATLARLAASDSQLLPEEVLDVSRIVPGDLTREHVKSLATMLKAAANKHGTSVLLSRLLAGTPKFPRDGVQRDLSVQLLEGADLAAEAKEVLPPLEPAVARGDVIVMLAHAKALDVLATRSADGPEADKNRREAFDLFSKVSRTENATAEQVKESIERAIDLMPALPRSLVSPWLAGLFTDPRLTRLTAEILAIEASRLADPNVTPAERAAKTVSLASAVEAMLSSPDRREADLAVPLRILAGAISQQFENASQRGASRYAGSVASSVSKSALLRAAPSAAWIGALDASVSARVAQATISLAISDRNLDVAVTTLRVAAKRDRKDASALAEHLLRSWATSLSNDQAEFENYPYSWMYRYGSNTSTRGEQQRKLASLREVIEILSGLGVDAKQLAPTVEVFRACHANDEIYQRDDIAMVFGNIDTIPVLTACDLADSLRDSVLRYWTSKMSPPASYTSVTKKKTPPPPAEMLRVIEAGYNAALELIESARKRSPGFWRVDAVGASVAYDRLRLMQRLGKLPPGKELEILATAFASFEQAARSYKDALLRTEQVESPDIFSRWFRAALGASDSSALRVEDLPEEGPEGQAQFVRIRSAIAALPEDIANRHIASFAEEINSKMPNVPSEVKPRFVSAALQVIADHPSGAPLVRLARLYDDYAKNDVRLRLTIDGTERVEKGKPFAVLLSLRYTTAVERGQGGFSQYLMNQNWGYYGSSDRRNRDNLELEIRRAFSKGFDLQGISWYEPSLPGEAVVEDGQQGWLQKPLALVFAAPKDEAVDRLPQVKMQLYFPDTSGEVTAVLTSNTEPLTISKESVPRPRTDLAVIQTLDTRNIQDSKDPHVILEVSAKARGVVPEIADLLPGIEKSLPGYKVKPETLAPKPLLFEDPTTPQPTWKSPIEEEEPQSPDPTLHAVRPVVERLWQIRFDRESGAAPERFTFATLAAGLEGKLANRSYTDTDLVPVTTGSVALPGAGPRASIAAALAGGLAALVVCVLAVRWWFRRRVPVVAAASRGPQRRTALSALTLLRRWQHELQGQISESDTRELAADIARLELANFGPTSSDDGTEQAQRSLASWRERLRR